MIDHEAIAQRALESDRPADRVIVDALKRQGLEPTVTDRNFSRAYHSCVRVWNRLAGHRDENGNVMSRGSVDLTEDEWRELLWESYERNITQRDLGPMLDVSDSYVADRSRRLGFKLMPSMMDKVVILRGPCVECHESFRPAELGSAHLCEECR